MMELLLDYKNKLERRDILIGWNLMLHNIFKVKMHIKRYMAIKVSYF